MRDRINKRSFLQSAREQVTDSLKLPKELMYGESVVTVRGKNEVFIENYRGISLCTTEEIQVSTKQSKLVICGRNLGVTYYSNDEMKVEGNIEQISFVE